MNNSQTSALSTLHGFMVAMRDWEIFYYKAYRAALSDGEEAKRLSLAMCDAKRKIIGLWCSSDVLKRASFSPSVGDPPIFDPERDELTVQQATDNKVVIEHTQKAGLEAVHRFYLIAHQERWIVDDVQVLEDDSMPTWAPMIL